MTSSYLRRFFVLVGVEVAVAILGLVALGQLDPAWSPSSLYGPDGGSLIASLFGVGG